MDEVVDVYCVNTLDPPIIYIVLASSYAIPVPKPYYDAIREPLGLPDVVCGGN